MLDGATLALTREGALDPAGSTTLFVDAIAFDEQTAALDRSGSGIMGRASTLRLVGRGRTEPGRFETGELVLVAETAAELDALADAARRAEALSRLAKRLGETIVMTILGLPVTDLGRL